MEKSNDNSNTLCPTGLRVFNTDGNVVRLACDRWACPVCRRRLAYHWATRVRYGIALWPGQARHWVITLSPKIKTSAQGFWVLPKAWDNFRKAMQRGVGEWHYAAFVELHPQRDKIAHLHIVSLQKSPKRLKDMAHHAGFGFIDSDDEITGGLAAYYVSKYTSKQGEQMPKNFHRVRLDRAWPALPDAIPDPPLLPMVRNETLAVYFYRAAVRTELTVGDVMARWEHRELDL